MIVPGLVKQSSEFKIVRIIKYCLSSLHHSTFELSSLLLLQMLVLCL